MNHNKPAKEKVYEGTTKVVYKGVEEYTLVQFFKDELQVGPDKVVTIAGKGVINNSISAHLMSRLEMIGVENHLIEKINMREQVIQLVDLFPIQVIISNVAAGRYVTDFGIEEGFVFDSPVIDFRMKNSKLNYPVLTESQLVNFGWAYEEEIKIIKEKALRICDFLTGLFSGINIRLVDARLEFGRVFNGEDFLMMLADEISPDTCRLWDIDTNEKLDFEGAMNDIDNAPKIYQEVAKRLGLNT